MDVSVPLHQEVPRSKNTEYHIEIKNAIGEIFFCHRKTLAAKNAKDREEKEKKSLVPWCAVFWWQTF
jgi:hypothetical protein